MPGSTSWSSTTTAGSTSAGQAVQAEPGTAYDVARALTWTRHEHALDDLDLFNAALATLETRAHLELLVARGEMSTSPSDGGVVYSFGG